ncbi:hypothetical protein GCM10010124_22330 [Pilimelia terevasa]|uniref:Uncharacterized protein n=1 Tax=Pilimelia terevasa TaxID=53372 RepID=A0A8J3FKM7_9ACTN|nr:hypothetical protein [Pilimelia terevasa]GGK29114.1 hypothetical protein GCM10010124_22330 [Pilimelia terevasa]
MRTTYLAAVLAAATLSTALTTPAGAAVVGAPAAPAPGGPPTALSAGGDGDRTEVAWHRGHGQLAVSAAEASGWSTPREIARPGLVRQTALLTRPDGGAEVLALADDRHNRRQLSSVARSADGTWSPLQPVPADAASATAFAAVPVGAADLDVVYVAQKEARTVSRRAGVWSPQRTLGGASEGVGVTAVHHRGRTEAFWISGGGLQTSVRAAADGAWSPPTVVPAGMTFETVNAVTGADGSLDLVGVTRKRLVGAVRRDASGTWEETRFPQSDGDELREARGVRVGSRLHVLTAGRDGMLRVTTRSGDAWGRTTHLGSARDLGGSQSPFTTGLLGAASSGTTVEVLTFAQGINRVGGDEHGWTPQRRVLPF